MSMWKYIDNTTIVEIMYLVVRWAMPKVLTNAHIEEVIKKANKTVFFSYLTL